MNTKIIALFLCLSLSACIVENSPVQLPSQVIQVTDGQSILIRLNEGELTVLGGENKQVRVDGQTLFPEKTNYNVTTVNDQIQIVTNYTGNRLSNPSIHLEVSVPNGAKLKIETEFASIVVRGYQGDLEASSVSGDILIEDVNGTIVARSNRGNIKVQDSLGKISVVGNYGLLTTANTRGDIGVSTIMGTITFNGSILADDDVRLETDHGPVVVNLSPDSSLNLQARSTSGDVACMLPNISTTLRTCNGSLNSGDGALNIRTVSGAVTLQLIP
ncbi:MAG TPA: DUF4097 family beta strand repeat-containing protein [Anaerolineales bacterium]|nr:DUF4097 family beta strand repeat-containing protein [Anaerolineales bacterium]